MPMNTGLHLCLVAVVVAITTAAPVSNEEKLIDVAQAANNLNRDKRADEMVYFGNQQNNAQSMAKKSDPSRSLSQMFPDLAPEQGEEDEGAQVTAHEATPLEADLNARAESLVNEDAQDLRNVQAVESAMHSAFDGDASDSDANAGEAIISDNSADSIEDTSPEEAKGVEEEEEEDEEEEEEGGEEEKENEEEGDAEEGNGNDDSNEEDDLNLAATLDEAGNSASAGVEADDSSEESSDQSSEEEGGDSTTESALPDGEVDTTETDSNVGQFLQRLGENKMGKSGSDYDQQELQLLRYYYNNFVYPKGSDNTFPYPDHYRRRRSSNSKQFGSPIVARRGRRIKRDLYGDENDDGYYGVLPWTSEEARDTYLSGLGDYSSTNTDLSNYFYNRLYNYLSDPYIDDDEKYYVDREDDVTPTDMDPEDWVAEQEYLQKAAAAAPTYWRYEPEEVSEPVEMSFPDEGLERVDYDRTDRRKRYFFPFGEEPETHWGAFVPEKRSYADALERLQRLALALSDDPRPYQQQVLEDYRK